MHEMHLLKDLLSDILNAAKDNNAKKVTKVYLRMGTFTEINPEILLHFFAAHAKGTVAEGAEVLIESSPTRELRLLSFDCE
ncbi:MAG: hydrogenase maturation nickel metallochaperone HypA [Candidatus Margulisbacteria bacterium]|nr:hydrogenase maturation nickel metallochaperone HypA [Candidatus Margulisiibacteriota bacterium]MBU1022047.1 hydrogenase maturation nickel metallochaperone HypA [Candidatus Margulisiibacteriota bacterium]MBU1729642.1 hydrogenase maturation nickel metallochaperone HypA [Candidatus Margulisiibacteriota bacterium]MBU1954962.1 hydrogenase maturation nickel metallochaperone HypA [Candidatus Margulisiibacteriota bacterium]